jgi:hypothetical protein
MMTDLRIVFIKYNRKYALFLNTLQTESSDILSNYKKCSFCLRAGSAVGTENNLKASAVE